jgi:serine protease Do
VKSGDVIDQLDGHKVLDSSSLQIAVSQDKPGQTIQLGILRNGQPMTLSATVGEYNKPATEVAENEGPAKGRRQHRQAGPGG